MNKNINIESESKDGLLGRSEMEGFGDLLFELSSDDRRRILFLIREKPLRLTHISKELGLNVQEISRHFSRLDEVGVTHKCADGYYRLTPYGEVVLKLLRQLEFTSQYREYFTNHTLGHLPTEFVIRIGELADSTYIHNVMDFLKYVENVIKDAEEKIWLLVDQYPVNSLVFINEALDRGVEFKCIEPVEGVTGPNPSLHEPEEMEGLRRARSTPLVKQRTLESVDAFLFMSENECVLAFPTSDGEFDYHGFAAKDEQSLKWCMDLFQQYWETAEPRVYISPTEYVQPRRVSGPDEETRGRIIVEGRDDSSIDYQAVQDAVDNYDEVILRGTFNLGTSTVVISRSTVIRGEGREDDIPLTKVYKSGWAFPFYHVPVSVPQRTRPIAHHLFLVDSEGADVTIENIHFTDFDYTCLDGHNGNSMTIRNNRITLGTGLGRGKSTSIGDQVIGIMQFGGFPGGVRIEGNYLDFALYYGPYGRIARRNDRAEDPNYRPDLTKHDCYLGLGINTWNACGKVIIADNVVRNINGRGIVAADNTGSAYIQIKNNTIISEIYGSYYGVQRFAGFGIKANSRWTVGPAPRIEISDNTIRCDKINYCGIGLYGPELGPKGAEKLIEGVVKNNRIHLENGSIGIFTESCDRFEITSNTLTGKAYYGIGIFPGVDKKRTELGAHENVIEDNTMGDLEIKDPDEYSKGLLDERRYPDSKAGSATAHIWLNTNTKGNVVKVSSDETVIDEGEDNTIIYE